jgi:hypothetical protein
MVLLMIITSIRGMSDPDFYAEETQNWRIQCVAQDLFNLSILAPSLLISGILVYRNRLKAGFFWAGSLVCTAYTFVIYAFSVHFNPMFLFYCWILGLSFYTLILFLNETGFKNLSSPILHRRSAGIASGFIILASILFLLLWLKDIVPGIVNDITPPVLIETGLITNPVHALDLSIILPAMFLAGWFQFRNIEADKTLLPVIEKVCSQG